MAWRLGRVVRRAQINSALGSVADALIAEAGGPASARRVFAGKIRGVETVITETGHSLGHVVVGRLGDDEVDGGTEQTRQEDKKWTEVRVPFMNENLAVLAMGEDGQEKVRLLIQPHLFIGTSGPANAIQMLATVPDLIFLLDASTGEAIGVQEYKYGVKVLIMTMASHPVWTSERGLEIAGPKAFNLPHERSSSLVYSKPRSVIDEFRGG